MEQVPGDGLDLVRLGYFGAGMETEVVLGLLKSCGIPAVLAGGYDYGSRFRNSGRLMVPRERVDEAHQIIREARTSSGTSSEPSPAIHMPWLLRIIFAIMLASVGWQLVQLFRLWPSIMDWFH